jgi:sulfonate dioxygenase
MLILAAAQRGVLVFRGQDLKDSSPDAAVRLGKHFGQLHRSPTMWHVKDHTDLQIVYEGPE